MGHPQVPERSENLKSVIIFTLNNSQQDVHESTFSYWLQWNSACYYRDHGGSSSCCEHTAGMLRVRIESQTFWKSLAGFLLPPWTVGFLWDGGTGSPIRVKSSWFFPLPVALEHVPVSTTKDQSRPWVMGGCRRWIDSWEISGLSKSLSFPTRQRMPFDNGGYQQAS